MAARTAWNLEALAQTLLAVAMSRYACMQGLLRRCKVLHELPVPTQSADLHWLLGVGGQGDSATLAADLAGRLSQRQQETVLTNRCLLLLLLGRKDACKAALASLAKR